MCKKRKEKAPARPKWAWDIWVLAGGRGKSWRTKRSKQINVSLKEEHRLFHSRPLSFTGKQAEPPRHAPYALSPRTVIPTHKKKRPRDNDKLHILDCLLVGYILHAKILCVSLS